MPHSAESAVLQLPYNDDAQDDGEITHNTTIGLLDVFAMFTVQSRTTGAQPGAPSDGDAYLIPAGATGDDWSGQDGRIGVYLDNGFYSGWYTAIDDNFIDLKAGMRCFVVDEELFLVYDGTEWIPWDNHIVKPSDTARASTTTTAADPALVAPVAAGRKYTFEIILFVIGDGANDVKFAMSIPAGASVVYTAAELSGASSEVKNDETDTGIFHLGGTGWPADAIPFLISGTLVVDTTAGDLELEWAQFASGATATTVKKGSYMTVNLAAA